MKISIIIVNWNTCELLEQCLLSIAGNNPNYDYEIWVVDNNSTDQSLEMLRSKFPEVNIIANATNMGFARANNQAMMVARGEYFLLLNSDTIVKPGALDGMVKVLDKFTSAGVTGCKLLNKDGSLQQSWAQFPTIISESLGKNIRVRKQIGTESGLFQVDWIGGACMLARKKAIDQVGMLDEGYFMYSEEVDWCYQMKKGGWDVLYLENVEIIHLGGGSANRSNFIQLARLYESKLRFFNKNYGLWQNKLLRFGLILANTSGWLRFFLKNLFHSGSSKDLLQQLHSRAQLIGWLLRGDPLGS